MSISIKAPDICPKIEGENDFYSWPLYRWLSNFPSRKSVFLGLSIDRGTERLIPYIGTMSNGEFRGRALREMCFHKDGPMYTDVFTEVNGTLVWEDITEAFWSDYLRIGVCAIFGSIAHDWEYISEATRKCKHCKKAERKVIKQVPMTLWESLVKVADEAA